MNGRQLQSYAKSNTNVSYTYDSNGMRLSKDVNGVKRNYLYNNGLLMQEIVDNTRILDYSYDSAGNPVSVAYRTSLSATPIYYYYAVNSRGDVVGIYTASGSLLVVYEYDAWGNILSVKNANGVNIANPNSIANIQSLRYRGYCYDTDTGFYYLQSRYYDPVTHRFINTDGYVSTGTGVLGYNLFTYCNNNPIINYDLSGTNGIPITIEMGRRWLVSGAPCPFTIVDITYAQYNGAQSNDVFFYDYSYTYWFDRISYESSMSTGTIYYYPDNVSYTTTKDSYSISVNSLPNIVTSISGKYNDNSIMVTRGLQFGNITFYVGLDNDNHLIGWDYSVVYKNNNIGSASGTLRIDNDTYDKIYKASMGIAVLSAAAVICALYPPAGIAIEAGASVAFG